MQNFNDEIIQYQKFSLYNTFNFAEVINVIFENAVNKMSMYIQFAVTGCEKNCPAYFTTAGTTTFTYGSRGLLMINFNAAD